MSNKKITLILILFFVFTPAIFLSGCVPYIIGGNYSGQNSGGYAPPPGYYPPKRISNGVEIGVASWYGPGFQGRPTASGQIYNMYDLTAASLTLPLDSYAYVTDLENHRSVEVLVDDRGPYADGRIMDLSYAAARALDMIGPGTALVRVQYLGPNPVSLAECKRYYNAGGIVPAVKHAPPVCGYTLQFAAYTRKNKALNKVSAMKKFVPGVHLIKKNINGSLYYKVVFGRFKNLQDAYNFAKTIAKYGYDVYITRSE
jgi:rare lipoprotein A